MQILLTLHIKWYVSENTQKGSCVHNCPRKFWFNFSPPGHNAVYEKLYLLYSLTLRKKTKKVKSFEILAVSFR